MRLAALLSGKVECQFGCGAGLYASCWHACYRFTDLSGFSNFCKGNVSAGFSCNVRLGGSCREAARLASGPLNPASVARSGFAERASKQHFLAQPAQTPQLPLFGATEPSDVGVYRRALVAHHMRHQHNEKGRPLDVVSEFQWCCLAALSTPKEAFDGRTLP